ncbi:hypothetical protein K502DRAFT_323639 [Neoconidiobolus thromboides FSU 785]|nr:hypothetical protein K502DRAFT_323639 [Neoconidiobolus thromboides FSU 785]
MGLLAAVIYLIIIYLFMPIPFAHTFSYPSIEQQHPTSLKSEPFPHIEFNQFLSGLLSIQAMTLLGFADDVFDIRWRHKVLLPLIAAIPLLMVYYISMGATYVAIPYPIHFLLGNSMDLGIIYYLYMAMVPIFCTNAINILAGINGVEVGQTIILCLSLILFNITQLNDPFPAIVAKNLFSLYMLFPLLFVSIALYQYNSYPAKVFVGDTYCYFSGMVFAVVGILGHFSKTLLLFFVPQIANFILSLPQLFHILPCPRHRMPRYNESTNLLQNSHTILSDIPLKNHQIAIILILEKIRLIKVERDDKSKLHPYKSMTNLTLLNSLLVNLGPLREDQLTKSVMLLQVGWSIITFMIRYQLAKLFYN